LRVGFSSAPISLLQSSGSRSNPTRRAATCRSHAAALTSRSRAGCWRPLRHAPCSVHPPRSRFLRAFCRGLRTAGAGLL
jgi:hypothetical protein